MPPDVIATLQAALGRALLLGGAAHVEEAAAALDVALTISQHYQLTETLAPSLNHKGMLLVFTGRTEEGRLHYEGSAAGARRHGDTRTEMRAEGNLADLCMTQDLPGAEAHCETA